MEKCAITDTYSQTECAALGYGPGGVGLGYQMVMVTMVNLLEKELIFNLLTNYSAKLMVSILVPDGMK